jgi:hypothetical protein
LSEWWSTRTTSKQFRGARRMCVMRSGLRTCYTMACSKAVLSLKLESRELRDLTRSRTTLVEERARAVNRLQKSALGYPSHMGGCGD